MESDVNIDLPRANLARVPNLRLSYLFLISLPYGSCEFGFCLKSSICKLVFKTWKIVFETGR